MRWERDVTVTLCGSKEEKTPEERKNTVRNWGSLRGPLGVEGRKIFWHSLRYCSPVGQIIRGGNRSGKEASKRREEERKSRAILGAPRPRERLGCRLPSRESWKIV